ncbi:MAG: ComEC/Rec2 family competence protein [Candidatus Peribacteraceae bacterium]|nr:ComEC/Rec2 family competence protein [Candidatus Peribacteraceae bacterium]
MTPSRLSLTFLLSFLATVFLLQWWQQASYPSSVWTALTLLSMTALAGCVHPNWYRQAPWLLAAVLGTTLAFFTVARTTHIPSPPAIESFTGRDVTLHGMIADEPDRRPMKTRYTVAADSLLLKERNIPVTGRILATDASGWPVLRYGEEVIVRGALKEPGTVEEFRYDHYLSRYDIFSVMPQATFERGEKEGGSRLLAALFSLKERFEQQINRLYPEPHASLMAGLLTGSRRGIPDRLLQAFNAVGLTHIIAISGYNITIVLSLIAGLLFWLPLKWRFAPSVAAIIAFTLFVGASASVVRAAIMGILGLVALQAGRLTDKRLLILWTLFFMLAWNPKQLWYDASFQLSFLAVTGLTELSPLLESWSKFLPHALGIREAMQTTISAQIAAVPFTALLFHRFSLIAPLSNLLAAPAVPLAMLFGALGTMVSMFSLFAGQIIAALGWMCTQWIIIVAELLARVPGASLQSSFVNVPLVLAYYALLLTAMMLLRRSSAAHHT